MAVDNFVPQFVVQLEFLMSDTFHHLLPPFWINSLLYSIGDDVLKWIAIQPHVGKIMIVLQLLFEFFHVIGCSLEDGAITNS
jgi:hypothetical protein